MYRSLVALTLAVVVAACSDDSGDEPAAIDEMRVVKVSGDQSAQVPAESPSASLGVRYATVGTDGWTDSALVARVEAVEPQASMTGPSFAVVPSGTLVHWRIADGGGELFGATTATDDSAYTYNRWRPGTVAGTYTAEAGRLIDGEIVIDATWTLEVMPGALHSFAMCHVVGSSCIPPDVGVGDTVDLGQYVYGAWDAYGNTIPINTLRTEFEGRWAWSTGDTLSIVASGTGWGVVVQDSGSTAHLWLGDLHRSMKFNVSH